MLLRFFLVLLPLFMMGCSEKTHKPTHQKLRLNLFTEPPTLDSRKATDSTSMNVLNMLFEGLTRIDADHKPYPAVAEQILISKDKKTYTFKLRESYWSNGDEVTADDFIYTWQKILDPKFPSLYAYKFYVIKNAAEIKEGKLPLEALGAKALDKKTLEVTLNYPTPYFLEITAFPSFYPVHQKTDQLNSNWAAEGGKTYVSNGPFVLHKWDHESEIVAKKNTLYWDADAVKLDSIHLAMIDDATTEFYMYEMNELDWAGSPLSNLPPEFVPALKKEGKAQFYPSSAVYFYKINTDHFPLGNKNIRKALGYAINRKAIVDHITQAGQVPALGLVPPMPGWEKASEFFKDGDQEQAQILFAKGLEEENLTLQKFPTLVLSYNSNREHQKIAQAIQQQWKEVLGIKVELETFDWKVYLSKINKQDYQIGRMGWVGDFHDPVSFLEPYKYRDNPHIGGNNETGWEHPDYALYLTLAEQETCQEKRAEYLRQAEELIISEMPLIPLYFIMYSYLKKPYVQGVYLSPLGITDFKHAYIQ